MPDFTTSLILKIISSLFFLLSGILWKKVLMSGGKNYHFIYFRVLFTLVLFGIICFANQNNEPALSAIFQLSIFDWAVCLSICLVSFWGLYFYTEALQNGRFSFVTPLMIISSAFSFFTSLIIYNEGLSTAKYAAFLLLLIGLWLNQKEKLAAFQLSKEVFFILLFSFFWGISFVFYLIPIKKFGVINFSIILETCVFVSCIGLLVFKDKKMVPPRPSNNQLWICLLMGVLVAGASLLSNFTLTQIPVSLNILIGLFFELIVLAIGMYFFREKLNAKDWILIAFATTGGTLLLF